MTGKKRLQYLFKSESQWSACLYSRADGDLLHSQSVFRPIPPYAEEPTRYDSPGARAPVMLRTGEILWSDNARMLHRGSTADLAGEIFPAPLSIACANRVVSTAGELWVISVHGDSLESYDNESLAQLITVHFQNAHIVDIAYGGRDTLLVLVERGDDLQCIRLNRFGHEVGMVSFAGISRARALVFLRRSQQFVVLAGERYPSLYWYSADGGDPVFSKPIATLLPCFEADLLGSDSNEKIVLTGSAESASARGTLALVLDADGNQLGQLRLEAPATGIAASRQSLIVSTAQGVLCYATADVVPNNTAEVQCALITPKLQSLDVEDSSPWLRIEASATLPEGTTLELAYAATDDPEVLEHLKGIADDRWLPSSQRIQKILGEPELEWSNTIFHGSDREPNESDAPFSAPLFDISKRHLWVSVRLTASRGAKLPTLKQLAVLYPGRSLVENLPTPYRRAAAEPGDFLRALVGVLETTTQNLDARIAALGSHIHPKTATGEWIDYIARWLSLPWDDALSDKQKQAILRNAADLASGRGTRTGLEKLLECLLPGSPRRFRVTDTTADFGYAVLGGNQCVGSALPAMLGGFTRWHSELDSTAVLGYTRLPCANQIDDSAQWLAGKIRVQVAAGAQERAALEPWLLTLITQMVPLNTRVELCWVSVQALRTDRLDDTLVLEAPPSPHLGTDAITGLSRLPEQRRTRLTGSGPAITAPLQ